MHTDPGFPKNTQITIEHLPSGKVWISDVEKLYTKFQLDMMSNRCTALVHNETDYTGMDIMINNSQVFFPAGVLQNCVVHLSVRDV
jgi:hypothetical protein